MRCNWFRSRGLFAGSGVVETTVAYCGREQRFV
jgi:hypothetical protein